jgi:hypothetical protein
MNDHDAFDDDHDEPEEPCFLAYEDAPHLFQPPPERGPTWWDGRWPPGGIRSLEDLEAYVRGRLGETISLYRSSGLRELALGLGRQAISNATRYLAEFGRGHHPPRPKPKHLRHLGGVETALENLLRHIRQERAARGESVSAAPSPPAATQTPAAPPGNQPAIDPPDPNTIVVDRSTFSVRRGDKECKLGNTKPFLLMERLSRRPGTYISVAELIKDVWDGYEVDKNTVQKTASALRSKLQKDGMGDLTIDGDQPDHYALLLPPEATLKPIQPHFSRISAR